MAFSYSNFFGVTGKLLKYINLYLSASAGLLTDQNAIVGVYHTAGLDALVSNLSNSYAGKAKNDIAFRQALAAYVTGTLLDRNTVLTQLIGPPTPDINSVLLALYQQMGIDVQTVKRGAGSIGALTVGAANIGNGSVFANAVLDGVNAPLLGAQENPFYVRAPSELCISELMTLTCTGDSYNDGLTAGAEQFAWNGAQPWPSIFDTQSEGSGPGPTLVVAGGGGLVVDGSFENWSTNTPINWTIITGAAGTTIFQENSVVYSGLASLKFLGNGSTAVIEVQQPIQSGAMKALQMYSVAVWIQTTASVAAGTINVQFKGTGYSVVGSESISIAHGSFPGATWTLYQFFITAPAIIPPDWNLSISVTGTLTSAKAVYFDLLTVTPVVFHGGVAMAIHPGNIPFVREDYFTQPITNSSPGVFQNFFRRWFQFQLPSSVSPTISDTLAT